MATLLMRLKTKKKVLLNWHMHNFIASLPASAFLCHKLFAKSFSNASRGADSLKNVNLRLGVCYINYPLILILPLRKKEGISQRYT